MTDTDNVNHNKGGNIYDVKIFLGQSGSKTKPKVFKPPWTQISESAN